MATKSKQICESSLRWILAMRRKADVHKYQFSNEVIKKHPEIMGDQAGDFGHSGGSFAWSVEQARKIDKIGLKKWLTTEDALGYGYFLKRWIR